MLALTLSSLAAHKARLAATALAVFLGVAFLAGTLIFTDTVGASFDTALAEADRGVDVYVRAPSEINLGYGVPGPRLDAAWAPRVAAVEGVDQVALRFNGYAQLVGRDGEPVGDVSKSPAFGANWVTVRELNPYRLAAGRAPAADDEIVIDKASADKAGYRPGDQADVLTKGAPRRFTIAGTARFGAEDSPAGATAVLFTDAAAAELLAAPGEAHAIAVTARRGVAPAHLAAAVQGALGEEAEVITGAQLVEENQQRMADILAAMGTIIRLFGAVALFVAAFIINNTFSITVAQRTREMAMLRALGASGRQVERAVLVEAAVVGVVASAAGLAGGVGVAAALRAMMSAFGFDMPDGATVASLAGLGAAAGVGVAVTLVSAWLPARRAARVAPIAALRDASVDRSSASAGRAVAGLALTAAGVATLLTGLDGQVALVGAGALSTFLGVAVSGPVIAGPAAAALGRPLRLRGVAGELAVRNAARNPTRTARTASSLMIGVGLVVFLAVFAASAKTSLRGALATEFTGTHIVDSGATDSSAGLSPALAHQLRGTPGVEAVTQARLTPAVVDGDRVEALSVFDAATVGRVFRLGQVQGDVASLGADGIAVSAERAQDKGWALGAAVPVTFPGGAATLQVEAIFDGAAAWLGPTFVDLAALAANGGDELDYRVYLIGDEATIEAAAAGYGAAEVLDRNGFLDLVSGEIDAVLGMFYAMLVLALVIALLGITNTLALSVFERRRELGLLRAVGMGRRQISSAVRYEAVIVAGFGAALGLAVGVFFGWAAVEAMAERGIDTLDVPVPALAIVALVAAGAGAAAALAPARRAARLDILRALSLG